MGRVLAPGVGHRQHPAVPSPHADAVRHRCEGRDGASVGIGKGGAARSLPRGRGRLFVGGRYVSVVRRVVVGLVVVVVLAGCARPQRAPKKLRSGKVW